MKTLFHKNIVNKSSRILLILSPILFNVFSGYLKSEFLFPIVISIEIILLLFLPGLSLVKLIFNKVDWAQKIGLSILLGLTVQLINILILYSLVSILLGSIDFSLSISLLTSIWLVVLIDVKRRNLLSNNRLSIETSYSWFLILSFIIAFSIRLIFQEFSSNPYTDGSLYLDFARNIVKGEFTTNVIGPDWQFLEYGLVPHMGVSFMLSILFTWVTPTYLVGKIAICLIGSLIIFPIFILVKRIFNEKAAFIAIVITIFHPLLLFYSCSLFGPEILSSLFVIASLLFFILGVEKNQIYTILSGIFSFLVYITWYPNFYTLLICVPIAFIFSNKKIQLKRGFVALFMGCFFLIAFRTTASFPFGLLWYVGVLILIFYFILIKRNSFKLNLPIFFLVIFSLVNFSLVRSFLHPEIYIVPTSEAQGTVITKYIDTAIANISSFGNTFTDWFLMYSNQTLIVLILLGFLSLAIIRKFRWKLFLLIFPITQLTIYALFMPSYMLEGFDANRSVVAISIPFIILASLTLASLLSASFKYYMFRINNAFLRRKPVFGGFLVFVFSIACLIPFYNGLTQNFSILKETDLMTQNNWGAAIDWIDSNTSPSTSLMARKTYDWAWYTNRLTINPGSSDLTLSELYENIKFYNVSFIMIDKSFYNYYKNLGSLYLDFNNPPIGFERVYKTEGGSASVIIYNTTNIFNSNLIREISTLSACDSIDGWSVWLDSKNKLYRGTLIENNTDFKQGTRSIQCFSSYMPQDNVYIAKFEFSNNSIKIKGNFINFWFKANQSSLLMKEIKIQIIDINNNYLTTQFSYNNPNQWENIEILIGFQNSLNSFDPENAKRIVFWFTSTTVPFSVYIDNIEIQKINFTS